MLNRIANCLLFRNLRARFAKNKLIQSITSELAGDFLGLLLTAMSLIVLIDGQFRRNIENFRARYLFKTRNNSVTMGVIFKDKKMKVCKKNIDDTNVTLIFKNQEALRDFLLSPKPDILGGLLHQDVTFDGNLNYLYKFAYMANRLKMMAMGEI